MHSNHMLISKICPVSSCLYFRYKIVKVYADIWEASSQSGMGKGMKMLAQQFLYFSYFVGFCLHSVINTHTGSNQMMVLFLTLFWIAT